MRNFLFFFSIFVLFATASFSGRQEIISSVSLVTCGNWSRADAERLLDKLIFESTEKWLFQNLMDEWSRILLNYRIESGSELLAFYATFRAILSAGLNMAQVAENYNNKKHTHWPTAKAFLYAPKNNILKSNHDLQIKVNAKIYSLVKKDAVNILKIQISNLLDKLNYNLTDPKYHEIKIKLAYLGALAYMPELVRKHFKKGYDVYCNNLQNNFRPNYPKNDLSIIYDHMGKQFWNNVLFKDNPFFKLMANLVKPQINQFKERISR